MPLKQPRLYAFKGNWGPGKRAACYPGVMIFTQVTDVCKFLKLSTVKSKLPEDKSLHRKYRNKGLYHSMSYSFQFSFLSYMWFSKTKLSCYVPGVPVFWSKALISKSPLPDSLQSLPDPGHSVLAFLRGLPHPLYARLGLASPTKCRGKEEVSPELVLHAYYSLHLTHVTSVHCHNCFKVLPHFKATEIVLTVYPPQDCTALCEKLCHTIKMCHAQMLSGRWKKTGARVLLAL